MEMPLGAAPAAALRGHPTRRSNPGVATLPVANPLFKQGGAKQRPRVDAGAVWGFENEGAPEAVAAVRAQPHDDALSAHVQSFGHKQQQARPRIDGNAVWGFDGGAPPPAGPAGPKGGQLGGGLVDYTARAPSGGRAPLGAGIGGFGTAADARHPMQPVPSNHLPPARAYHGGKGLAATADARREGERRQRAPVRAV